MGTIGDVVQDVLHLSSLDIIHPFANDLGHLVRLVEPLSMVGLPIVWETLIHHPLSEHSKVEALRRGIGAAEHTNSDRHLATGNLGMHGTQRCDGFPLSADVGDVLQRNATGDVSPELLER